jgi:MFS family permease
VLGYSALEFGLGTAVFAALAAVGSIVGQAIVLRVGFRAVATAGMALMGAGSLLLTQASVGGSYFGDIFLGLLLYGIGLAFVTATVAALAGVAERESGLASGLSNTAFQIGAALGVAIATTVAVSRSEAYLTAHEGANPLVVLTEGFQSAFLACGMLAGIGVALALLLLGRPSSSPPLRGIRAPIAAFTTSSTFGPAQPPSSRPPRVSSSARPGAPITPSSERFLMTPHHRPDGASLGARRWRCVGAVSVVFGFTAAL